MNLGRLAAPCFTVDGRRLDGGTIVRALVWHRHDDTSEVYYLFEAFLSGRWVRCLSYSEVHLK